jgi:hypothetical protein
MFLEELRKIVTDLSHYYRLHLRGSNQGPSQYGLKRYSCTGWLVEGGN